MLSSSQWLTTSKAMIAAVRAFLWRAACASPSAVPHATAAKRLCE
jgi:hypothetical protein